MKLMVSDCEIEIFETEKDYINFIKQPDIKSRYHGKLYGIPKELNVDLVELKKKCYVNVEFVLIY